MRARFLSSAVCLGWAMGCAVYDATLIRSSPKTDGATGGGSVTGAGGASIVGGGAGGTDVGSAGTSGGNSLDDGGPVVSGGSGGGGGIEAGSAGNATGGSFDGAAGGAKADAAEGGAELLIDNMEHAGDAVVGAGFAGHWYGFNDQTDGGVETPFPFRMTALDVANAAAPASNQAAHALGIGFTGFGCGMGVSIGAPGNVKFNASAYTGVTFWAHVGAGAQTHITVSTFDTRAETGCVKCNDQPLASFDATTTWQKFRLPFALFRQAGFGDPQFGVFDPKGFGGLQFYIGGGSKLDLWIDDVAFYAQ